MTEKGWLPREESERAYHLINHRERWQEFQRRATQSWHEARIKSFELSYEPALRSLLTREWGVHYSAQEWKETGFGGLIGLLSKKDLLHLIRPTIEDPVVSPGRSQINRPSHRHREGIIFPGHGWKNVLVIPTFRWPRQISGWLYAGRAQDNEPSSGISLFRPVIFDSRVWNNRRIDSGVAFLEDLPEKNETIGKAVIVTDRIDWALAVRDNYAKTYKKVAPIVWVPTNMLRPALLNPFVFYGRKLIFWSDHLNLDLLTVCADADGYFHKETRKVERSVLERTESLLASILKKAKPWFEVWPEILSGMPADEIASVIRERDFLPGQINTLLRHSPNTLKNAIDGNLARSFVYLSNCRVEKGFSGLNVEHSVRGKRINIANFSIKVEKSITYRWPEKKTYWKGLIEYGDQLLPFFDEYEKMNRDFRTWISEFFGNRGMSYYLHHSWNRRTLDLALLFHSPESVLGPDFPGWSKDTRQFHFLLFAVDLSGKVSDSLLNPYWSQRLTPCKPEFSDLGRFKDLVSNFRQSNAVSLWRMVTHRLSKILSPLFMHEPVSYLFSGPGLYRHQVANLLSRIGYVEVSKIHLDSEASYIQRDDHQIEISNGDLRKPIVFDQRTPSPFLEVLDIENLVSSILIYYLSREGKPLLLNRGTAGVYQVVRRWCKENKVDLLALDLAEKQDCL